MGVCGFCGGAGVPAQENAVLKGLLGFKIRSVVCTPPDTFSTCGTFD